MRDPAQDPERRHASRAWRLMEALEYAPFGNEARLAVAQKFLDEERGEALGEAEANRPEVRELVAIIEARQGKRHVPKECHVPECSCH